MVYCFGKTEGVHYVFPPIIPSTGAHLTLVECKTNSEITREVNDRDNKVTGSEDKEVDKDRSILSDSKRFMSKKKNPQDMIEPRLKS